MTLRPADIADLPQLKQIYKKIIEHMNHNKIQIWDEIYPCDFFKEDIEHHRLYVLTENGEILSAFALCDSSEGASCIKWKSSQDSALYIDRFGVNVNHLRKGIGSLTLGKAIALANEKGADYLRLFVVDINTPAIRLYTKNGFERADGVYDEVIDSDLVFHEFGFEIKTSPN